MFYSKEELKKYWTAWCPECGWVGLSRDCGGGNAIVDLGDCSDPICPKCYSVVNDYEYERFSIKDVLKWAYRFITFWAYRKNKNEEKALDKIFKQWKKEQGNGGN